MTQRHAQPTVAVSTTPEQSRGVGRPSARRRAGRPAGREAARRRRGVLALVPALALGLALVPAMPAAAKKKDPVPPIVSGWLPYWTTNASLAALQENKDLLAEVSPFWYTVKWSGGTSVIEAYPGVASNKGRVKAAAAAAGVELWPSFTDSMPVRRLAAVMAKKKTRQDLADKMVALAVAEGYAGLDLDFEKFAFSDGSSTWATTTVAWRKFVKRLGTKLHAKGKKLAATTPPMCSVGGVCGSRSGYWVYDWKGIAPYIDRLRIMAYDYSWSVPGPIGPYNWGEAIVRYAITQVEPQKVQLGVPTYGREWVRRDAKGSYLVTGTCPKNKTPSDYLARRTFDSATVPALLASRGNPVVQWNDTYKESFYRYSVTYSGPKKSCTVHREGWFGDARSVAARAGLATQYGIGGIAAWTIGNEDPAQWSALRDVARGNKAPGTTVTVTAPKNVDFRGQATVRATAHSAGAAVSGATATLQWRAAGTSSWQTVATARTSASGSVAWKRTISRPGTFRVVVDGSAERGGGSGTATLRVRPVVVPKQDLIQVARGGKAKLRAKLSPKAGQRVVVQKRVKGSWAKYADARMTRAGNPKLPVRVSTATAAFRFKVKASSVSTSALSSVIKVRAR